MHWELDEVERPFVEQLTAMGWRYVAGNLDQPAKTGRASFAEVVQEGTLRRKLHALNLRDVAGVAQPWLDHKPAVGGDQFRRGQGGLDRRRIPPLLGLEDGGSDDRGSRVREASDCRLG